MGWIANDTRDTLINELSAAGATALEMLAAARVEDEYNLPNRFAAGYAQGYAHAIDMACAAIMREATNG